MADIIDVLRSELAGRYDVERQIGQGGMATVFLARDLKHQRAVAIKVLRPEFSATIGTERFNQEIEIAARLQHPHILPVYDSGAAGEALFYVMPYVEGESLKERIEQNGIAPQEALRIGREVASALDYAHRQGVVHRDIKPANILLSQGHAVVADFGIARAASGPAIQGRGLTQVGTSVGTPWYMSPEQAVADPNVDGRSDIFALGCVLYEMLEGHPPFDAETPQSIIAKIISAPVPDLPRGASLVPEMVPVAIRKALAKDPNERFQTAADLEKALELGTGEIALARARKPRTILTGAVVAIAVALAAVVGFSLGGLSSNAVADGADLIAVLPFDVSGADADLGEGMVSLLSTNLNAVGTLRTVDARTVLQRWRSLGGERGLDLAGSLQVGRDVNASSVLVGTVVRAGPGVRLNAELYAVDGNQLARVQIDGDANNIIGLVDTLSLEILHEVWRSKEPMPSFDVAAITSRSIDAVRAYVRGRAFLRKAQWDSAAAAYEEAISIDSTFALAHLELSETYGWTGHGGQPQIDAADKAAQYADRLPPREQHFVGASQAYRNGEAGALDSLRAYTERYPSDPRGWYALGDAQHHTGEWHPGPEGELESFNRAIALDSSYLGALVHPMEISLRNGERELFRKYIGLAQDVGGTVHALPLAETAIWGDSARSIMAWDSLLRTDARVTQLAFFGAMNAGPESLRRGMASIERILAIRPEMIDLRYRYAMVALATGRMRAFENSVAFFESHDEPTIRAFSGLLRVLAVLGGLRPPAYAGTSALDLLLVDQSAAGRAFVESVLDLNGGNIRLAQEFVNTTGAGAENTDRMRHAINGWIALIQGDTATGINLLRETFETMEPVTYGGDQVRNALHFQLARALAMRPDTHTEGMNHLRYGLTFRNAPEMMPASYLAAAAAAESMNDLDGALEAYSNLLQLWSDADPELRPRIEDTRNAIARLNQQKGD